MELKDLSSNWKKLQASLNADKSATKLAPHPGLKRKRSGKSNPVKPSSRRIGENDDRLVDYVEDVITNIELPPDFVSLDLHQSAKSPNRRQLTNSAPAPRLERATRMASINAINAGLSPNTEVGKYVAIDCEMVGVGPNPDSDSALARVSIVNFKGDQIYDSYVKPKETVTDWRTPVSGIMPKHMMAARTLEVVQADVTRILDGKILIGHAIRNDLDALLLSHPKRDIRDTARYPPYRQLAGGGSPRLKMLAAELLGLEIQEREHSSVEDARATMLLYQRDRDEFERHYAKKWPSRVPTKSNVGEATSTRPAQKSKKGKKKR